MKDAAQGVAEDVVEDVPQDVAQDLAFEARAVRALLTVQSQTPQPSLRSSRLAEMGAQLGSSQLAVAFDSGLGLGVGKRLRGGAAQSASMFIGGEFRGHYTSFHAHAHPRPRPLA